MPIPTRDPVDGTKQSHDDQLRIARDDAPVLDTFFDQLAQRMLEPVSLCVGVTPILRRERPVVEHDHGHGELVEEVREVTGEYSAQLVAPVAPVRPRMLKIGKGRVHDLVETSFQQGGLVWKVVIDRGFGDAKSLCHRLERRRRHSPRRAGGLLPHELALR